MLLLLLLLLQSRVVLDPYSKVIVNGRRWFGEMGPVSMGMGLGGGTTWQQLCSSRAPAL